MKKSTIKVPSIFNLDFEPYWLNDNQKKGNYLIGEVLSAMRYKSQYSTFIVFSAPQLKFTKKVFESAMHSQLSNIKICPVVVDSRYLKEDDFYLKEIDFQKKTFKSIPPVWLPNFQLQISQGGKEIKQFIKNYNDKNWALSILRCVLLYQGIEEDTFFCEVEALKNKTFEEIQEDKTIPSSLIFQSILKYIGYRPKPLIIFDYCTAVERESIGLMLKQISINNIDIDFEYFERNNITDTFTLFIGPRYEDTIEPKYSYFKPLDYKADYFKVRGYVPYFFKWFNDKIKIAERIRILESIFVFCKEMGELLWCDSVIARLNNKQFCSNNKSWSKYLRPIADNAFKGELSNYVQVIKKLYCSPETEIISSHIPENLQSNLNKIIELASWLEDIKPYAEIKWGNRTFSGNLYERAYIFQSEEKKEELDKINSTELTEERIKNQVDRWYKWYYEGCEIDAIPAYRLIDPDLSLFGKHLDNLLQNEEILPYEIKVKMILRYFGYLIKDYGADIPVFYDNFLQKCGEV